MGSDRFTDLAAILARLPESKRAELGWHTTDVSPAGWYNTQTGLCPLSATLSDHYAALAVVLIELAKRGMYMAFLSWDEGTEWTVFRLVDEGADIALFDGPSIFTAAAAAAAYLGESK